MKKEYSIDEIMQTYNEAIEHIKKNECQLAAALFLLEDEENSKKFISYFKKQDPPVSSVDKASANNNSSNKGKYALRKNGNNFKKISKESEESVKIAYDEILLKKNKIIFIEELIKGSIKNGYFDFFWELVSFLARSFSDYFILIKEFKTNKLYVTPVFLFSYFQEVSTELVSFFEKRMNFLIDLKKELSPDKFENKNFNGDSLCEIYKSLTAFYSCCYELRHIESVEKIKELASFLIEKSGKHVGKEKSFSLQLEEVEEEIRKEIKSNPSPSIIQFKEMIGEKIKSNTFSPNWIEKIKKRQKISEEDFLDVVLFFNLFIKDNLLEAVNKKIKFIFTILFDFLNQTMSDMNPDSSSMKKEIFLESLNLNSMLDKITNDFLFDKKENLASLSYLDKMEHLSKVFKKEKADKNELKLLREMDSQENKNNSRKSKKKSAKKKKAEKEKTVLTDKKVSHVPANQVQEQQKPQEKETEGPNKPTENNKKKNKKNNKKKKKKNRSKSKEANTNHSVENSELRHSDERESNEALDPSIELVSEVQPLIDLTQWHVTAHSIELDKELNFIFKQIKSLNDSFKLYCFGGYIRDKIEGRPYADFDFLIITTMETLKVVSLLMSSPVFLNCRIAKRKENLITAEFKYFEKTVSLDFTVQGEFYFSPFLDTHAFCVDEFGFLYDRSVLNQYLSLDDYRNRNFILSIYPKDQLIEQFKTDPIKMIKALKDSAKVGKNLHSDIVDAIDSTKMELAKLPWSQILSQFPSVSRDSKDLGRFLQACKHYKLVKYVFFGFKLKNLNSSTLNWVGQTSMMLQNLGCTSPYSFLIAPLLVASFYQPEMQEKEFGENRKYIFYFSLHCAFYFLRRFRAPSGENRSSNHLMTFKHWFSDLFLGLFLILTNLETFNVGCLKNNRTYDGYLKLEDDFWVGASDKLIGFDFFNGLNIKSFKNEQNKITQETSWSKNNFIFTLIRILFAIHRNNACVENFEKSCENFMKLSSFQRESVVEKVGSLIVYLINYPFHEIEMIQDNFKCRFDEKNRLLERSMSVCDFRKPTNHPVFCQPSSSLFKPLNISRFKEVEKNRENIPIGNFSKRVL